MKGGGGAGGGGDLIDLLDLLALPANFASVMSSFLTQNKGRREGGGGGWPSGPLLAPPLDPPLQATLSVS